MLLKTITIKQDGNILKKGCVCTVIQIDRAIKPEMYYCWYGELGLGEWFNRSEIRILSGEKKPRKKKSWVEKQVIIKKKKLFKTAEDFLIG